MAKRGQMHLLGSLLPPPTWRAVVAIGIGVVILAGVVYVTGAANFLGARFGGYNSGTTVAPGGQYTHSIQGWYGNPDVFRPFLKEVKLCQPLPITKSRTDFSTMQDYAAYINSNKKCSNHPVPHADSPTLTITVPSDADPKVPARLSVVEGQKRVGDYKLFREIGKRVRQEIMDSRGIKTIDASLAGAVQLQILQECSKAPGCPVETTNERVIATLTIKGPNQPTQNTIVRAPSYNSPSRQVSTTGFNTTVRSGGIVVFYANQLGQCQGGEVTGATVRAGTIPYNVKPRSFGSLVHVPMPPAIQPGTKVFVEVTGPTGTCATREISVI